MAWSPTWRLVCRDCNGEQEDAALRQFMQEQYYLLRADKKAAERQAENDTNNSAEGKSNQLHMSQKNYILLVTWTREMYAWVDWDAAVHVLPNRTRKQIRER